MKHRTLIITVGIALCAVLVGILYIFTQPPTINSKDFTTKDQALAIRLSKTRTNLLDFNPNVGYLVLADASGNTRAFNTGSMPSAQPLWSDLGVFYAGAKSEFFTNDQGTKEISRDFEPNVEYARYVRDDGRGFIAFYGGAGKPGEHKQPVVVGSSEKTTTINVAGDYMNMGVCEDTLYALTQTRYASHLLERAQAVYQEHTGASNEELAAIDNFDVLVQVYPADQNNPQSPRVLESVAHDESISHANKEFQRYNNGIYLLSYLHDNPDASRDNNKDPKAGHAVLEAWDLANHTRRTLDIIDPNENFIDIDEDDMGGQRGVLDGSEYRFVTRTGKVYSVDVTTGAGKHLFIFEALAHGGNIPRFDVTSCAVYRLDNGEDDSATLDFSRYVFKTGAYEHLFDVKSLAAYRGENVHIVGIAVNPNWEKTLP